MLQPKPYLPTSDDHRPAAEAALPMFGALDAVLVDDSAEFAFDGAITHAEARAVWTWLRRDLAPEFVAKLANDANPARALSAALPTVLGGARAAMAAAKVSAVAERRLIGQLGGIEIWQRVPAVLNALKCVPLLEKATAFGRALNGIEDEAGVAAGLEALPREDAGIAGVLMMAMIGEIDLPGRLVAAALPIAGGVSETRLADAGFAPLIDALLAHAQNTLPAMRQQGLFADVDRLCAAVERFHRLLRAVSAYVELQHAGRWARIVASLTKTASDELAPRLRGVVTDINVSLRRLREGTDRLDEERLLTALNGLYVLVAVRDARDSLALNQLFDETWLRSGEILQLQLDRCMDALREEPKSRIAAARVDVGIKMSELRFGRDYADVLRTAREGIERQVAP